ncbi:hypothetical protein JKP88DRAFT_308087 [Tribonema minus]|uniref:Uncharacterized protein n=1 Tax=Tribonema minus TaxID=303371 RepID=A0A835Z4V6_9STRA|nr:hypothetical protein JKP88DRAFT_308087 [Tribonema minus]
MASSTLTNGVGKGGLAASLQPPHNLKELLASLKSVIARNVAYKPSNNLLHPQRHRERDPRESFAPGLQALPSLVVQLSAVGDGSASTILFTSAPSCPTLNPTWPVSETAWLDVADGEDLEGYSCAAVHVFEAGVDHPLLSACLQLSELQPLPAPLSDIPRLPLNAILLELATGHLFAQPWIVDAIAGSRQGGGGWQGAHHHSASSLQSPAFTFPLGSAPGPLYDAEEQEALDALRARVRPEEARAAALRARLEAAAQAACPAQSAAAAAAAREHSCARARAALAHERRCLAEEEAAAAAERAALAAEAAAAAAAAVEAAAGAEAVRAAAQAEAEGERARQARSAKLVARRGLELAGSLKEVYPIRYDTAAGGYAIRGLVLDLGSREEEVVAAALAYATHLTSLLAKYLNVTLRYQLFCGASRSAVRDAVLGTPAYPLFRRGAETERFERGVALLSRDVEQLLAARGLAHPARAKDCGGGGGALLVALQYLMAHCAAEAEAAAAAAAAAGSGEGDGGT